jgi:hypothetical protein
VNHMEHKCFRGRHAVLLVRKLETYLVTPPLQRLTPALHFTQRYDAASPALQSGRSCQYKCFHLPAEAVGHETSSSVKYGVEHVVRNFTYRWKHVFESNGLLSPAYRKRPSKLCYDALPFFAFSPEIEFRLLHTTHRCRQGFRRAQNLQLEETGGMQNSTLERGKGNLPWLETTRRVFRHYLRHYPGLLSVILSIDLFNDVYDGSLHEIVQQSHYTNGQ